MDIPGKQMIKVWSGPHSDHVLLECLKANAGVSVCGVACHQSVCSNIHLQQWVKFARTASAGFIFWKRRLQKIPSKFQGPKRTAWNHNTNVPFVRLSFSALLMSSPAARTSRRKMGRPSVLTGRLGSSRRMPLECQSFASTPWLTVKRSSHVQESGHW